MNIFLICFWSFLQFGFMFVLNSLKLHLWLVVSLQCSTSPVTDQLFMFVWWEFTLKWFDVHYSKHQLIKKKYTYKYKSETNCWDCLIFLCCWTKWSKRPTSAMTSRCTDSHLMHALLLLSHLHSSQSSLFLCVKMNKGTRSEDVLSGNDITPVRTSVWTSPSPRWGQLYTNQLCSPVLLNKYKIKDGVYKGYAASCLKDSLMLVQW